MKMLMQARALSVTDTRNAVDSPAFTAALLAMVPTARSDDASCQVLVSEASQAGAAMHALAMRTAFCGLLLSQASTSWKRKEQT